MHIGEYGQGILNIRGGGTVTSPDTVLGFITGSTGIATVTGANSTWNASSLFVGNNGEGTLNIEDGGTVLSDNGSIGNSGSSTNIATVTGANSIWDITGTLQLSFTGSAILNIEDGGTVSSAYANMGFFDIEFATSIVTVTGANSTWNNSGVLNVGIGADLGDVTTNGSTLNIETGGTVSVGNEIRLNSNVSLFTAGLPGDFDSDDDIDGFDFFKWQRGFGGTHNDNDLAAWEANFGTAIGPVVAASVTAVPEPTTGILLVLGMGILLAGRLCQNSTGRETRRKT